MIRINLLPHREFKRAARRRQIAMLAGLAAAAGVLIVLLVHAAISQRIDYQQRRNEYLKQQIALLDKQITEIKKLKEQIQALLARKQVVEKLQANRAEVVHLMDQLVRVMPDGVYLTAMHQSGNKINLVGYAESSARVSTLMRNIEASPWLASPQLVEIKAATVGKLRLNEFILNADLATPQAKPGAGAAQPKDKKS